MIIYDNKKVMLKLGLIFLVFILFFLAIYYTFFNYKTCEDLNTYLSYQQSCKRAVFVTTQDSISLEYKILGTNKGLCKIQVKALDFYQGYSQNLEFKGKEMICTLEKGSTQLPNNDLKKCSGELKEEFLYLMIEKLYVEVYENLDALQNKLL